MAEYIFVNEKNVQGKNTTFNPTNKLPIIGSRIWATLADLEAYLNDTTSSAIAGIQVAVVADPNPSNNGTYEIIFDNPALLDSEQPYIGIKDGKAMTPTVWYETEAAAQAAVQNHTIDSYRQNIAIIYKDEHDEPKSNLTYRKLATASGGSETVITYNETEGTLNATTGAFNDAAVQVIKEYVDDQAPEDTVVTYNATDGTLNATEGLFTDEAVNVIKGYVDDKTTDTVITYDPQEHTINATTGVFNDTAMGVIKNYIDDQAPDDTVVTYNTVAGTLNATEGLFNDTAVNVIKEYVDDFDCGSFTI